MLYVFKTHGWFDVPFKPANDKLRRQLGRHLEFDEVIKKPVYIEGCVSVLKFTQSDPMLMFHYDKKESLFYYKEELPYIEHLLNKYGVKYAIYNAKTNECVQSYPAIFNPTIDIALEPETVGDVPFLSQ
jgi:hypothetical protein